MRDYQRKLNNSYSLPHTLYRRVLAVIRDYDRQREEINNILYGTAEHHEISGGFIGKPTENTAVRILQYTGDIEAVEKALETIPEEYRMAVLDNIRYGDKFPYTAGASTWARWKAKFVYEVAKKLQLI